MKNQIIKVKNTQINVADLIATIKQCCEVSAAYLFGSAAKGEGVVNDLDILVLLHRNVDKHEAYINLTYRLSQVLNISEDCIDLLFLDSEEADPIVLTRAVNKGILLKNDNPEYLSDTIDCVSRYLMDNEAMIIRGKRLRQERLEVFCET
jgi:predicted nucleotidyltransferase